MEGMRRVMILTLNGIGIGFPLSQVIRILGTPDSKSWIPDDSVTLLRFSRACDSDLFIYLSKGDVVGEIKSAKSIELDGIAKLYAGDLECQVEPVLGRCQGRDVSPEGWGSVWRYVRAGYCVSVSFYPLGYVHGFSAKSLPLSQ